jgi:hypothetical protein
VANGHILLQKVSARATQMLTHFTPADYFSLPLLHPLSRLGTVIINRLVFVLLKADVLPGHPANLVSTRRSSTFDFSGRRPLLFVQDCSLSQLKYLCYE